MNLFLKVMTYLNVVLVVGAIAISWYAERLKKRVEKPVTEPTVPTVYAITLIAADGTMLGGGHAPSPLRHIHVYKSGLIDFGDEPEPGDDAIGTFDRVASAVWVDDVGSAMYVQRTT